MDVLNDSDRVFDAGLIQDMRKIFAFIILMAFAFVLFVRC